MLVHRATLFKRLLLVLVTGFPEQIRCLKQNPVKTKTVSFCKYLEYGFGSRILGSSVKTLQSYSWIGGTKPFPQSSVPLRASGFGSENDPQSLSLGRGLLVFLSLKSIF